MVPGEEGEASRQARADEGSLRGAEDYLVAVAALAAEALIAAAAYSFGLRLGFIIVMHAVAVGLLALWLKRRRAMGGDLTIPLIVFIVTVLAGPVGSLGAVLAMPFLRRAPRESALLAAWYRRISLSTEIDPSVRLANSVAAGRSIDVNAPVPPSFEAVMVRGSLHERQTALGLIARKFHPDYAPALKAALKSPEPVVRVQAAAVAAKLRGELKRRLTELIARMPAVGGDARAALGLSREIAALNRTGLLDSGDAAQAAAAVRELDAVRSRVAKPGAGLGRSGQLDKLVEADLIAAGRFADLRRLRQARRLSRPGLFRVRLPVRTAGEGRT